MKKGTIIALVALILVLVAFFATRKEVKTTVEAPYVLKAVSGLGRIELTRGSELVVLEEVGGSWTMTKPVNAPLAEPIVAQLKEVFATDIKTDDIRVSEKKAADLELADTGTKVALYGANASGPAVAFTLGKEITVEGTNVRRSFIMTDKSRIFRLQRSLDFLRKPVSDLRSKVITTADSTKVSELKVTQGGQDVVLTRTDDVWTMVSPEAGMPLEKAVIEAAVSSLSNLRALEFADDRKPAEVGLEPPSAVLEAKVGESTLKLELGKSGADWFVRMSGEPFIYKVAAAVGENLALTAFKVRNRIPLEIMDIQSVEFSGDEKAIVSRTGETWMMVRPTKKAVPDEKISLRTTALGSLRVARFAEVTLAEAGLDKTKDRIVVRAKSGKYELLLGDKVEGTEDRYAKWATVPHVFVLQKYMVERLTPTVKDLTET